ncbi:hypothetical protein MFIFM68171_02836 [Madurella fahalii]|uniref:Uncharacterized protein n=1 Tax=Madurella fahalii TaxID=1157608 RepID=A0ABQ0G4F9_9PEZI
MKFKYLLTPLLAVAAAAAIIPRLDADEAVAYPAQVDQSWVDANTKRDAVDADEAVAYPAQVDQSWVDAQV